MRWLKRRLCALVLVLSGAPANAEWHEARSEHFIVYADQAPEELREFSQRLERFDRAARTVMRMKDPPLRDSSRLTVFVVNNLYAIEKLAGDYGVAGFYIPRAAGSVVVIGERGRFVESTGAAYVRVAADVGAAGPGILRRRASDRSAERPGLA